MSSSQQSTFSCGCGKSYASIQGLRQHQRRYCRGVATENENTCNICATEFGSYAGMRQHMRLKHPEQYNNELQAESANARSAWTAEEEDELAKLEASCDQGTSATAIIDLLHRNSTRTREAIKGRRKQRQYIEKVIAFRSAIDIEEDQTEDHSGDANSVRDQLNMKLKEVLCNIPSDSLKSEDQTLRDIIVNQPQAAATEALETWYTNFISQIVPTSRGRGGEQNTARSRLLATVTREDISRRKKRTAIYKLAQMAYAKDQKSMQILCWTE